MAGKTFKKLMFFAVFAVIFLIFSSCIIPVDSSEFVTEIQTIRGRESNAGISVVIIPPGIVSKRLGLEHDTYSDGVWDQDIGALILQDGEAAKLNVIGSGLLSEIGWYVIAAPDGWTGDMSSPVFTLRTVSISAGIGAFAVPGTYEIWVSADDTFEGVTIPCDVSFTVIIEP